MASSPTKIASESGVHPVGQDKLNLDENTLRAIAEVYNNAGNGRYEEDDLSNAIHFYTKGIQVNCKDEELKADMYSNRADAYFCLGNYEDSLRDAKLATGFQPMYIRAIVRGASACVQLSKFDEAITWCEKGLASDKDNQKLLELRSRSVEEQNNLQVGGRDDNANEYDVIAATEITLDNDESNLRGASACVQLNQFEEAITWCDKRLAIDKNSQELLEIRDRCVREQSKLQAALKKAVKDQSGTQTLLNVEL